MLKKYIIIMFFREKSYFSIYFVLISVSDPYVWSKYLIANYKFQDYFIMCKKNNEHYNNNKTL